MVKHLRGNPVILLIHKGPVDGREFVYLNEKDNLSAEGVVGSDGFHTLGSSPWRE